jgi:hypothetical protein
LHPHRPEDTVLHRLAPAGGRGLRVFPMDWRTPSPMCPGRLFPVSSEIGSAIV